MSADTKPVPKKPYASPKLSKLTPEDANLLLLDRTVQGNQEAKDLLDLLHLPPE